MDEDAGVFKALADPTRRQILQDLQAGELGAGKSHPASQSVPHQSLGTSEF